MYRRRCGRGGGGQGEKEREGVPCITSRGDPKKTSYDVRVAPKLCQPVTPEEVWEPRGTDGERGEGRGVIQSTSALVKKKE